jgi:hypothetical protein
MNNVSLALGTLNTEFDRIYGLMGTSTTGFKEKFVEQMGKAEQGTKDLRD